MTSKDENVAADKALRMLALDYMNGDLRRLKELVEESALDDPKWALVQNLVTSIERNAMVAFDASGSSLRDEGMAMVKREAWLERVTRTVAGGDGGSLAHAQRGMRLACDPTKVVWGNTVGRHYHACDTCRLAVEANRIREGGTVDAPAEATKPEPSAAPEAAPARRRRRAARVLRGGKQQKVRAAV